MGIMDIPSVLGGPKLPSLPEVPKVPKQRRIGDPLETRRAVYDRVLDAARTMEPTTNAQYTLRLDDVDYADPEDFPLSKQKDAILRGETVSRRLRGTWKLIDNVSGSVLDQKTTTVARVPYLTGRGTMINNGSEYTLKHQMRLRPGAFSRQKENGEIEAHINVLPGKGASHRIYLDPAKGTFYLRLHQAKIPLMPLMRAMGAQDAQLRDAWGSDLLAANYPQDDPVAINKLYLRLVKGKKDHPDYVSRTKAVAEAVQAMELDPEVTRRTLGADFSNLNLDALLATTRKLLGISRGEAEVDDRDHLAYQTVLGPEDLLAERLTKDSGGLRRQLLFKATFRKNLSGIQPGVLDKQINSALLHSGLGQALEEINPAEIFDKQSSITRLGQGGIESIDAVPEESRAVQPSHLGFIDPLRTPESFRAGVDVFLANSVRKGDDGRLYAPFVDVRTGQTVFRSPQDVADVAIAFPGELRKPGKRIVAMQGGRLRYVPRDQVQYEVPHFENAFSPLGNLVPMKSAVKGQRVAMASRMTTQALPLSNPETPLVQSAIPGQEDRSFEEQFGEQMGAIRAKTGGTVLSVSPDEIKVQYDDGTSQTHELYNNFPYNRKSVTGDTQIFIKRGAYIRSLLIGDYAWQAGDRTLSIDPDTKNSSWLPVLAKTSHSNDKQLLRIATSSGRSVTVTEDHSLMVMGADGCLQPCYPADLRPGHTRLPIAMLPVEAVRTSRDHRLGLLIGLYLSEGHAPPSETGAFAIAVEPDDRAQQVIGLLEQLGASPVRRGGNVYGKSAELTNYLVSNFGHLSHGKHIPDWVLHSPLDFRQAIVAGYMAGDGCLWADSNKAIQVAAVSVSRELRDGMVDLLATLGVFTTLWDAPRQHLNENWRDGYGFRVISRHLATRVDGGVPQWFFYTDREAKFRRLLRKNYRNSPFELVPVPREARRLLYAGFEQVSPYVYKTAHQGAVSKDRLQKNSGAFGLWGRSDVLWDEVVAVVPVPHEEQVYDLSVATSECFAVCHGLVVHNTYAHNTPVVQPGARINPGALLARSNFTDANGSTALGLNARVAYLPFRGMNFEDALVISDSMAQRLSSEHMYQHGIDLDDRTKTGKAAYLGMFPSKYERKLLDQLDNDGVIKPGAKVEYGQPLILAARQKDHTLNKIHRRNEPGFADRSEVWEHHSPGVVTDVIKTPKGPVVLVKSTSPMQVGDKMSGRYGDKGVISEIVPDDQMPRGADGQAFEVLLNPLGIISRTNPAQLMEAMLGKIASKTGQTYRIPDFEQIQDLRQFALDELRKHNVQEHEDVVDPQTGRKIPKIVTGNRFFMKLHHTAECYDDQTEVLTRRGWVPWPEATKDDEFATVDTINYQLIYEKPVDLVVSPYVGQLYGFEGRYVDYSVTHNHRMFIRGYGWQEQWGFRTANEVQGARFAVMQFGFLPDTATPETHIRIGDELIEWNDYAELVGWWATEGYAKLTGRSAYVTIYQSEEANPEHVLRISQLVDRLPWPWHYYRVKGVIKGVTISSRDLAAHVHQYGTHCQNKRLPRHLLDGPISGRQRLFAAMMSGDGNAQETKTGPRERFTSTSKQLADDFQELCIRLGFGAVVRPDKPRKQTHYLPAWTCGVALSRTLAQIDGDRNKQGFTIRSYIGNVYCATMRTGLLYVRRNGKPMLCGNSKMQGRGTGGYTAAGEPAKGGETGSKRISLLDVNAILSHGATAVLRDAGAVRGQRNEEFWLPFLQGFTPEKPKVPMVFHKFVNELKASGINVLEEGDRLNIMALTNRDIDQLAGDREISSADTVRLDKGLAPIPGGLFDPKLTGGHHGNRWAAIKLFEPLPNPVMEEPIRRILGLTGQQFEDTLAGRHSIPTGTGPKAIQQALEKIDLDKSIEQSRAEIKSGRKTSRDQAVRRLGYLLHAKQKGLHPSDWMLSRVPVLPPAFRPISVMSGNAQMPLVSDANYLYKELLEANENLRDLSGELDDVGDERLALYNSFKAVTGLGDPVHPKLVEKNVQGLLKKIFGSSPKFGTVQRRLISSTTDLVGRAVISPDPDLDMDHVGLPENRAWDIYKNFIARRLKRRGLPLTEALRNVENRTPLAKQALLDEMSERPVIINRAPVLHRFGIMAFYPKLTKGDTLRVSPLVVKGFGADFDGDAMQYHVPVLDDARREAVERMLPSQNLFSPADFKSPMHMPSQEYVGGLYSMTTAKNDRRPHVFATVQDAVRAYKAGQVDLDDQVEILK